MTSFIPANPPGEMARRIREMDWSATVARQQRNLAAKPETERRDDPRLGFSDGDPMGS